MLSSLFLLRLSLFVFTVGFFVFVFFLIVLSIIVNVTRASPSGCFTGSITIFSSCLPFPPPPPAPQQDGGQVTRNCTENTSIEEYFVQEVTTQILLFFSAELRDADRTWYMRRSGSQAENVDRSTHAQGLRVQPHTLYYVDKLGALSCLVTRLENTYPGTALEPQYKIKTSQDYCAGVRSPVFPSQ